jgi:hypothetical protein
MDENYEKTTLLIKGVVFCVIEGVEFENSTL